jgi:hypothetical protein
MDSECVHAAGEFTGKCRIDHAVALDSALSAKGFRYDIDPEMGLAARPVAGMAGMLVRLVYDPQVLGIESFGQLSCDEVLDAHGLGLCESHARRSMLSGRRWNNAESSPVKT